VTIVPSPESARDCVHWMHRGKSLSHERRREDGKAELRRAGAGMGKEGGSHAIR
jgi:hypothetical protein